MPELARPAGTEWNEIRDWVQRMTLMQKILQSA